MKSVSGLVPSWNVVTNRANIHCKYVKWKTFIFSQLRSLNIQDQDAWSICLFPTHLESIKQQNQGDVSGAKDFNKANNWLHIRNYEGQEAMGFLLNLLKKYMWKYLWELAISNCTPTNFGFLNEIAKHK